MAGKKKYYAVAVGRKPGIYNSWFGNDGAEIQVKGFPGARYKSFITLAEAKAFLEHVPEENPCPEKKEEQENKTGTVPAPSKNNTLLFTDGSALGNPGPGGYGIVIKQGKKRKELSGGYRLTTNNRMELLACILGLKAIKKKSPVTLYTDSRYVSNSVTKGWARKWRDNDWKKSNKEPALNSDLWAELLTLLEKTDVEFVWVKGHAGHKENERCDQLARKEAAKPDLPPDVFYEVLNN